MLRRAYIAVALLALLALSASVVRSADPLPEEDPIVHVTKSGKKYHRPTCQHVRNGSTEIRRSEALRKGFTPCSVCKPG